LWTSITFVAANFASVICADKSTAPVTTINRWNCAARQFWRVHAKTVWPLMTVNNLCALPENLEPLPAASNTAVVAEVIGLLFCATTTAQ